jgi:hypothetical protein
VVIDPPDLQPALAGFLCLVLAGLHAAGSVAVLRILSVCGHHVDRLAELDALEAQLQAAEEKRESPRR